MRVLVLGGTVFLGRAVVETALARGDQVTIFHRGQHGAELFPEAERVHGDRATDLGRLAGRRWDLVVDTCGFTPGAVAAAAQALAGVVDRYAFVSTLSVYRDWPAQAPDEDAARWPSPAGDAGDYGALKAACERAVETAMPGRAVLARAGLLVGPHENIGRLPCWLTRIARGGATLAPGHAQAPVQLVDVRDLAAWVLDAPPGAYNVVSPPGRFRLGELLDACRAATGSDARFVWVRDHALLARGVEPWSGLPLWVPATDEYRHTYGVPVDRAVATGLTFRPLADTARDTWQALAAGLSDYRAQLRPTGLDAALEAELLAEAAAAAVA